MSGRKTSIEQLREEKSHLLDEARNITERMQKRTYAKFAPASDSYFNAEEAVEWGLADRVIHQL